MIEDIKTMFSEKPYVCSIMVVVGVVVGVVLGVFTPIKNWFGGRRR